MLSVKRIQAMLELSPEKAKLVRTVLETPFKRGEPTQWETDSPSYELEHDSPSRKLYILNRELDGFHGVEIIRSKDDTPYEFHGITYLNTGDSYATTLLYDHNRGTWLLSSWGDIVERDNGRRYE